MQRDIHDTGKNLRMNILRDVVNKTIITPFHSHAWDTVSSEHSTGEYIIVTASKNQKTRKVALLYTSATDNKYYKELDTSVDAIFVQGDLYKVDSYAYGIQKTVSPVAEFFPLLIEWNKEISPVRNYAASPSKRPQRERVITSENPITGIWSRLDQFSSITLAERLVSRRAAEDTVILSTEEIQAKATGVAFEIRNASDYFRGSPSESLNKRIVSLYYGTLALASAEMLVSPTGAANLEEVEKSTTQGHGLYTVQSESGRFENFNVSTIATGFFPRWLSFLGYDISNFPKKKAKTVSDLNQQPKGTFATICDLLSLLPEIGDLFLEVFEAPPSWIVPLYDRVANPTAHFMKPTVSQPESTYIHLYDSSGRISQERLQSLDWPIAEISLESQRGPEENDGCSFRARVDHPGQQFWHGALKIHHSPFLKKGTLILPVIGDISDYRAISFVILYALSILVRYMPSSWRRIEGGNLDENLALLENVLTVFERVLPQAFLEAITGERIRATQPGSLF